MQYAGPDREENTCHYLVHGFLLKNKLEWNIFLLALKRPFKYKFQPLMKMLRNLKNEGQRTGAFFYIIKTMKKRNFLRDVRSTTFWFKGLKATHAPVSPSLCGQRPDLSHFDLFSVFQVAFIFFPPFAIASQASHFYISLHI